MLNVCVCVVSLSQPSSRDLLMLNVCVCVVSLSQPSSVRDVKSCVCVFLLSQPSSRDQMLNVCVCCLVVQPMLNVKCLCVLSRYLSPVVEIW